MGAGGNVRSKAYFCQVFIQQICYAAGCLNSFPKIFLLLVVACLFVAGVLALVCATSPSPNMRAQQWIPRAVAKWADDNPTFRNFPVFAAIGFLAAGAIGLPGKSSIPSAVLAGAVVAGTFGTGLEVAQIWLRGRFFDPNDIAWTVSGAFAGALAALPFFWLREFFKRYD
jgi:hypothetical protein